jgi:hypothetical protein
MKNLRKKMFFGLFLMVMMLSFFLFSGLFADPDDKVIGKAEIEKMREQIQVNGWTFEVDLIPGMEERSRQLYKDMKFPEFSGSIKNTVDNTMSTVIEDDLKLPRVHPCVSTPIVDQGTCSSWPYASNAMFESVILLRTGQTVRLSEPWLLECNPYGWDCVNGWFASDIFFREGAVLAGNFTSGGSCIGVPISYQANTWHFCGNGYSVASTTSIKNAIYNYGSVACLVYVDMYFQAYTSGVFNAATTGNVNHFVTLCGWDDTKQAWRLKNSWGYNWGENGYMWIDYGCHDVGFAANYLDF